MRGVPDDGLRVELAASPSDGDARSALWAYTDDMATRYLGRQATGDEIAAALVSDSSDDLFPPAGALLIARRKGSVVGCAGLRRGTAGTGEVKRVFVSPAERGRGLGRRLMLEVERMARSQGVHVLRLDTRSDLFEARALYAALGYKEVPAFNASPYAEHWFEKHLREPPRPRSTA